MRVLHVTGDVRKCVGLTQACDAAALSSLKLSKQQMAAAELARQRLEQVDL